MPDTVKRVLIVEQSPLVAMELRELVEQIGRVQAECTGSPEAALAAIEQARADCAVLNIQATDGTMLDFAEELAARGIPWIFVSGHHAEVLEGRFAEVPFVEKPFDPAHVLALIQRILGAAPAQTPPMMVAQPPVAQTGPGR